MDIKMIQFQSHGDERGELVALEQNREIPFEIRRVYYMYGTNPSIERGHHAHKNLKQVLICVNGSCKIRLFDGYEKAEVVLDNPKEGLLVESFMWREMYDFSDQAVLLVLASEYYDESDYVRDFQEYQDMIRAMK